GRDPPHSGGCERPSVSDQPPSRPPPIPGRIDAHPTLRHAHTVPYISLGDPMADALRPAEGSIPDKPALECLESKWDAAWTEQGTYLFDRVRAAELGRAGIFSVDTPPPTA